jgi:hypothetical protein
VLVGGAPALVLEGAFGVTSCTPGAAVASAETGKTHEVVADFCIQGVPVSGSSRVTASGAKLLLASSSLIGLPCGKPMRVIPSQFRVEAL